MKEGRERHKTFEVEWRKMGDGYASVQQWRRFADAREFADQMQESLNIKLGVVQNEQKLWVLYHTTQPTRKVTRPDRVRASAS